MKPSAPIFLAALLLAACNAAAQPPPIDAPPPAPPHVGAAGSPLPEGGTCAGDIERYRAIQEHDITMGHVANSVYNKIKAEIAAAEAECNAGTRGACARDDRRLEEEARLSHRPLSQRIRKKSRMNWSVRAGSTSSAFPAMWTAASSACGSRAMKSSMRAFAVAAGTSSRMIFMQAMRGGASTTIQLAS